jgi:four helix bundle protein
MVCKPWAALARYPVLMGIPTTHRDVLAWREAMALVEAVYRDTARFPAEETFALAAQIRNAALAVPSHLAEGVTRDTIGELIQFLGMSCGSLAALETQLEIAVRLGYIEPDASAVTRTHHLGVLVTTLRRSLRNGLPK